RGDLVTGVQTCALPIYLHNLKGEDLALTGDFGHLLCPKPPIRNLITRPARLSSRDEEGRRHRPGRGHAARERRALDLALGDRRRSEERRVGEAWRCVRA